MRAATVLMLLGALAARANELSVDKRTLQADDTVTITLTLEGALANIEAPRIPVQNLIIDGGPSVSSEFQWINGKTSRRKIFRYTAHPSAAGGALVGPLTLRDSRGVLTTLPSIPLVVMQEPAQGSSDPVRIMRELIATNRDPIFIIAQADKSEVFEGEEVVVTWTLYTGASVQQYSLGAIPKLDDFWTEELDARSEEPQQVMLGGVPAQKLTIRRAALFPIRSGTLSVGPMTVHAAVMKRINAGDPFGLFEGVMTDVHRRSASLTIAAKAIPTGSAVTAATSVLNIACGSPSQRSGGPVVFDVTLTGRANLRGARPPEWKSAVNGNLQIIDRGVKVYPVNHDAWMTRKWRYLLFPAESGTLVLPPLNAAFLTPSGERREARCEAKTLEVSTASPEGLAPPPARRFRSTPLLWPAASAAVFVAACLLLLPGARRQMRLRSEVRRLVHDTPGETRTAVEAKLLSRGIDPAVLLREASDRGDAFRGFRSLIDAAGHDRIAATSREIAHRIRDLLVAVESVHDHDAAPHAPPIHDR